MSLEIIILAAGQGKRMLSNKPKVLHNLAGKPMLQWVVECAQRLNPKAIHVIYGNGGDLIRESLPAFDINWVFQAERLGTGHAVLQALPFIDNESNVLILSADVPLISCKTLINLIEASQNRNQNHPAFLSLLLVYADDPFGLGRIIRDTEDNIIAIVEEKDATPEQKKINEVYSGICLASAQFLADCLPKLSSKNAQGEYYLTEIIAHAVKQNIQITCLHADSFLEIQGVNDRLQLHQLERNMQYAQAKKLLLDGVFISDANRIDIRGHLTCGQDVVIDINNLFIGEVTIGNDCYIAPNCILNNVTIGDHTHILANSFIENSHIGSHCQIGPFARLREGTLLADNCKIGNFVETKKAVFSNDSKASHLSYLGDVEIGRNVNIGAGTITCNYDGANKHQTIIQDGAFIGSDTQLVAPVTIGAHATIGAGSTIRKDAPPGELTLTETKQKTIIGWTRPIKKI